MAFDILYFAWSITLQETRTVADTEVSNYCDCEDEFQIVANWKQIK